MANKINCIIVTKDIRQLAEQAGINPSRMANFVGIWQTRENSPGVMPNLSDIKTLMEEMKSRKEFEDEQLAYVAKGQMVQDFSENTKRPGLVANTTIDAIRNGERTATTRYEHIDYWNKLKEGDIVRFDNGEGAGVYVRITKPLTRLTQNTSPEEWSKKEGWSVAYFNSNVKPKLEQGAWQIEYEYVTDVKPVEKSRVSIFSGEWTRDYVEKQTDKVFLFGDNTEDRTVTHHIPIRTQAVIRGLPNAIGIDTKKDRGTSNGLSINTANAEFYSGGAEGADKAWAKAAEEAGIKVINYTTNNWDQLSDDVKQSLDNEYLEVVHLLGRRELSKDSYSGKLVRRDMMQADKADAIFAVGTIGNNGYIDGGTGYASTRGILRGIPVYLFDQKDSVWKVWNNGKFIPTNKPQLTNHAAVIGTRQLQDNGKVAINSLFERGSISEGTTRTINIYAGARENAELSNFAERPFIYDTTIIPVSDNPKDYRTRYKSNFTLDYTKNTFPLERAKQLGLTFKTVEGAFQAAKLGYVKTPEPFGQKSPYYTAEDSGLSPTPLFDEILTKLANASGAEAKRIGRTIQDLQVEKWDRDSSAIMKVLIGQSFEQNSEARQKLLATGDAVLTHTQDKGKWGTEFPKLLMEVREELGGKAPATSSNSSYFTDADFDQFKAQVDEAIQKAIDSGKTIVIPKNGIGTGEAQLEQRAPKLFAYLQSRLADLQDSFTIKFKDNGTAGYASAVSISTEDLANMPVSEKAQYTPEEITFDPAIPNISKEATLKNLVTLNSLFTPQQLANRISNVAYLFSAQIDALFAKKKEELRKNIETFPEQSIEGWQAAAELARLQDSKDGRDTFVNEYLNINDCIAGVKQSIRERLSKLEASDIDAETKEYQVDQFKKMLASVDVLLPQALSEIERNEGTRIVMSQKKDVNGKNKTVGQQFDQDDSFNEEDDFYERVASGNTGWAYKQREIDPRKTITKNVRRVLSKIQSESAPTDDLGYPKYLDSEYVYATLLNNLSWMIDSNDFHTIDRDETGKPILDEDGDESHHLPAIDEIVKKYQWLQPVRTALYLQPELIPEFYSCFRLDYIPYYMLSTGKFAPVNKEMSLANAIDAIMRNYEQGNTLSDLSIFSSTGILNFGNAAKLSGVLSDLLTNLKNEDWEDEDYNKLKDALNALGIEVDASLSDFLALDGADQSKYQLSYQSLSKILTNAKATADNLKEVSKGEHLITHFSREYTNIAKIVGSVTQFNKHMTFRQGEKDYPSYATPNFASTTFKKLLSTDPRRRAEIFDFYKQTNWFYNEQIGGWQNFMLDQLENNQALVEELRDGCLVNMNTIRRVKSGGGILNELFTQTESVPYEKWTPQLIKQAFVKAYFSVPTSASSNLQYAFYNFPIFADSTCAMFFKFSRFTDNYQQQILPLLRRVVMQELARQKLVADRRKAGAAEIANFDANGDKFHFFDDLNTYQSTVEDAVIRKYYIDIFNEAEKNKEDDKAEAIRLKLEALGEAHEGTSKAPFKDVIFAYKAQKNINGVYSTIDNAIVDIMDGLFRDFMLQDTRDNLPLITSLVEDGIIPKSEIEAAQDIIASKKGKGGKSKAKNKQEENKEEAKVSVQYNTLEEALREYFWNNALMQTQIIELMCIDPAYSKFDGGIDFQKRFKEVFASGRKLDTSSKYGRQTEKAFYLADMITASKDYSVIEKVFEHAVANKHMTETQKEDILAKFRDINNTDAQAFRCLSSMRAVLDMSGVWTDQMQSAYDSIMSGNWDPQNTEVIWQTLKPFMYSILTKDNGLGDGGKILVPHQNKNSEFLILAAYQMVNAATAGHTKLRALSRFMEKHELDVAMYDSAVKSGAQNPIDINTSFRKVQELKEDVWEPIESAAKTALGKKFVAGRSIKNFREGTIELLKTHKITNERYNELMSAVEPSEDEILEILEKACYNEDGTENLDTLHFMPYSDYMIATPTPEHWIDSKVVDGSQKRNLVVADMPDDPNFRVVIKGKEYTKQEVLKLYDSLHRENLLDSFESARAEFSDPKKLQESLLEQIKGNPKYPREFQNHLTLTKVNGKEDFATPIEFPVVRNKMAEIMLSKFKNKVTRQKRNGGSCILVADTQNSLGIVLEDGSYLNAKDKAAVEKAKQHNLIRGFECLLPAWTKEFYERYIKTVTGKDGKTWQELNIEQLRKEAPELLEMVGIRIPTEDKYSITPLIVKGFMPAQSGSAVMLPADMTTIVGLDFDVDKMFISIPNFEVVTSEDGKTTKLKKVEYDYSKSPKEQSRAARENALLDIELAILRNKHTAEALFNPGNFDEPKRQARIGQILTGVSSNGSKLFNIWQEEHGIAYEDVIKGIDSVQKASLDELKKFVSRFEKKRSLLSLDTFIYNHQQNMAGAGLIGIYANNTTSQAKMQTTNLELKEQFTFSVNGRKIKSLHDIYTTRNGIKERISKICSYFSAASVDNVKDPNLKKLNQNLSTAKIAGFMTRAGFGVDEIMLFFKQPFIDKYIENEGIVPPIKDIKAHIKNLCEIYKVDVPKGIDLSGNITSDQLSTNIVLYGRTRWYSEKEMDAMPLAERQTLVRNLAHALLLFNRINRLSKQLNDSVSISRADSPNGAISSELHLANKQVEAVDEYMANEGRLDWGINNIHDIMGNRIVTLSDSKDKLREKLSDPKIKVPRLQAFYSLGIELPLQLISPYFLSQSSECQSAQKQIEAELFVPLSEDELKVLYGDYDTYLLSNTSLLGDSVDENGKKVTMEEKRDYYLYQFPQRFEQLRRANPELAASPALINLRVANGEIIMEGGFKITQKVRDSLTSGFDALLFGPSAAGREIAAGLFMYSYYNEGFIPRHNSYGQFFSAAFLQEFPEALNALRGKPNAEVMKNFVSQWLAQERNMGHFARISETADVSIVDNNHIIIKPDDVPLNYSYLLADGESGIPYTYVVYNRGEKNEKGELISQDELWALGNVGDLGVSYYKVDTINAGPTDGKLHKFNAKQTAEELAAIKPDKKRIENLRMFNSTSPRQEAANQRESEVSGVESVMGSLETTLTGEIDEEQFASEIESPAGYAEFSPNEEDYIYDPYGESGVRVADSLEEQLGSEQEKYPEDLGQQAFIDMGEDPLC